MCVCVCVCVCVCPTTIKFNPDSSQVYLSVFLKGIIHAVQQGRGGGGGGAAGKRNRHYVFHIDEKKSNKLGIYHTLKPIIFTLNKINPLSILKSYKSFHMILSSPLMITKHHLPSHHKHLFQSISNLLRNNVTNTQ